jgi:hypothetical protein
MNLASFASCDRHLPNYLREIVTDNKSETVRVSNLSTPSETHTCGCNVPAQWYIRIIALPRQGG